MGVAKTPLNMSLNHIYCHLLSIILGIFLLAALSNTEQDFHFGENEIKPINSRVVKTPFDDEDYLSDSSGFNDLEGSGEDVHYEVPKKAKETNERKDDNTPEYYRSSINLSKFSYDRKITDRNSDVFKKYQKSIGETIESLFDTVEGTQAVTILEFTPEKRSKTLLVTFDLGTVGFYDNIRLFNVLKYAVNIGRIGEFFVDPTGFQFRELSGPEFPKPRPITPACPSNEFQCDEGTCINPSWKCDGTPDCPDNSDERDCEEKKCDPSQFKCDNGECLDGSTKCNGRYECSDGSDEYSCDDKNCDDNQFRCEAGSCISSSQRCDGRNDCGDNSDELDCEIVTKRKCDSNEFACSDGTCISEARKCDNFPDCPDSSDERDCKDEKSSSTTISPNSGCLPEEFTCDDGDCISADYKCDGYGDCEDNSDEKLCDDSSTTIKTTKRSSQKSTPKSTPSPVSPKCPADEFECDDETCIRLDYKCDGYNDCPDNSDETKCDASTTRTLTIKTTQKSQKTTPPLPSSKCADDEFACDDSTCIRLDYRCDKYNDCPDSSDETNCDGVSSTTEANELPSDSDCPPNHFACDDGSCVPNDYKCDGVNDCPDKSDETQCDDNVSNNKESSVATTPIPTEGKSSNCNDDQFECNDKQCIPLSYKCDKYDDCNDSSDETNCEVSTTALPPISDDCTSSEFQCNDGQCISISKKCDGSNDCADGSDENQCSDDPSPCGEDEFECDDGECVGTSFKCDGYNDCPDGSDEKKCDSVETSKTTTITPACGPDQFKCGSGECIRNTYKCDKYNDCEDESDETNCDDEKETISTKAPIATTKAQSKCRSDQFTCNSGDECINGNYACDGFMDCADKSDESNCEKTTTKTRTSTSIRNIFRTTSAPSYGNCGPDKFKCNDGKCINAIFKCDVYKDCADGSDEIGCFENTKPTNGTHESRERVDPTDIHRHIEITCRSGEFQCDNGLCINKMKKCNVFNDCGDGSDEKDCADIDEHRHSDDNEMPKCKTNEFMCENGLCISMNLRCNIFNDCGDGSDEYHCSDPTSDDSARCNEGEYTCDNGFCIPKSSVCNKIDDCFDNSDEFNCDHCCWKWLHKKETVVDCHCRGWQHWIKNKSYRN